MTDLDEKTRDRFVAMLPGDGEPEDHVFEKLVPSKGRNRRVLEQAREGHRVAEEDPERGAYHGGPPVSDMGGVTVPYDQRMAAPSTYTKSSRLVERKMKIQTWDESKAELRAERAKLKRR